MLLLMNSKECKKKKKTLLLDSKNTITGLPIPYSVTRDYA